jgi:hypothetical protein
LIWIRVFVFGNQGFYGLIGFIGEKKGLEIMLEEDFKIFYEN